MKGGGLGPLYWYRRLGNVIGSTMRLYRIAIGAKGEETMAHLETSDLSLQLPRREDWH